MNHTIQSEKFEIRKLLSQVFNCEHRHHETRLRKFSDGNEALRDQCKCCGAALGQWKTVKGIPKDELHRFPLYDQRQSVRWKRLYSKAYSMLSSATEEKFGGDFWTRYDTHIASPVWKSLRQQIIDRAESICEICENAPIKDIHHLTYDRLGDEKLDDLVGVCRECHKEFHPHRWK